MARKNIITAGATLPDGTQIGADHVEKIGFGLTPVTKAAVPAALVATSTNGTAAAAAADLAALAAEAEKIGDDARANTTRLNAVVAELARLGVYIP